MMTPFNADPILFTGFVSSVVGVGVFVLTKVISSRKYPTREEMEIQIRTAVREVVSQCVANQALCPVHTLVQQVVEIKNIQKDRTKQLESKSRAEFELWRTVLTKFKVPVDHQNEMLRGLTA